MTPDDAASTHASAVDAMALEASRALRHHQKQRVFFEALAKALRFVALFGSAGAVLALLEVDTKSVAIVLSALAAIATFLDLVLSPVSKLERHTALRNRLLDVHERLRDGEPDEDEAARCARRLEEIRREAASG